MKELVVGKPASLLVPDGATDLVITHEWGDVVLPSTAVSETYTFTPDSIGVYKIEWQAGGSTIKTDFRHGYVPLISAVDFFADYPDLEAFEEYFPMFERIVRGIIQNYTGQQFGPYVNKSLEIQGDGGDALALPVRVVALTSVGNSYGDDISELLAVSVNEPSHIIGSSRFSGSAYYEPKRDIWQPSHNLFSVDQNYTLTGTFGWEYVPIEVSDAAALLISDIMGSDDVAEMRRKGVFEAQIGDFSYRTNADQWGTTGNTMADNLLAGYTTIGFGLI
jgi:hypothetical protein